MANDSNVKKKSGNAKTTLARPGPLQNEDEVLEYHTHQTIMLVKGRPGRLAGKGQKKQHPIMGLLSFASALSPIHDASKGDDPFADLFLLEIETRLNTIRANLVKCSNELEELAKSTSDSIQLKNARSKEPSTFAARFKSPYAFGAAYLLQDLDNYISHVFSLGNRMVFSRDEVFAKVDAAIKPFRSLFTFTRNFKPFGVIREDFKLKTAASAKAIAYYGNLDRPLELSEGVLSRTERAKFAPVINAMYLQGSASVDPLEAEGSEI